MAMQNSNVQSPGQRGIARILGRLGLGLGIALAEYLLLYRPRQLRWGATDDEIQPHPVFDSTRAIRTAARPEEIWPWLVQIGYGRAGWYGYDWIDNDGHPSADHIIPSLQQVAAGDTISIKQGSTSRSSRSNPMNTSCGRTRTGAGA